MYRLSTVNSRDFHNAGKKLRNFFEMKGFIEVATQPRLSILSACEDPTTIATFQYSGQVWPLKQTGQMDLEYELLTNTDYPGVFCQSTSYRQEANPIPGRHDLIFPMFEFEGRGGIDELIALETELLEYLGFTTEKYNGMNTDENEGFLHFDYLDLAAKFQKKELEAEDEERIGNELAPVLFLKNFPEYSSPFWNMKRNIDGTSKKVDVILYGIETIGSAERETDPDVMMKSFHSISDGKYAELLYSQFGRNRVLDELSIFLDLPMTPRFGGGIGMTRMIRALKLSKRECAAVYNGNIFKN
jgi:aspartyl/asparaginyl-tRNA synthetase